MQDKKKHLFVCTMGMFSLFGNYLDCICQWLKCDLSRAPMIYLLECIYKESTDGGSSDLCQTNPFVLERISNSDNKTPKG